jgi:hypothetical protein
MPLTAALAEVLRGGRAEFNRRFGMAQQRYQGIDEAAFSEFVRAPLDAIAGKIARVDSTAVAALVDSLYDLGLALIGQRWIGPGGRAPAIVAAWEQLADNAPALFARQPATLATAVANALVHWSTQGGGDDWLATFVALAQRARNVDDLLHAGQVAAWRHGMAHYRDSALERARALDPELLALALGVAPADWRDDMLARIGRNRWFRPDQPPQQAPRLALRVGAFIGFGGHFAEPPLVGSIDGQLLLHAAGQRYSLHVDAYGGLVQAHSEGKLAPAHELPPGWRVEGSVLVSPEQRFAFAEQGAITSSAVTIDTLVVTHAWSHAATVVALL